MNVAQHESVPELDLRTWGSSGRAAMFAALHEDLVVEEPPFLPYGGTHRGVEAFARVLRQAASFVDLPSTRVENVVVDGDRAFRTLRIRLTATGEEVAVAEEMTIRDGRIATIRVFWFDPGLGRRD